MSQPQSLHRAGNALRLLLVKGCWLPFRNRAVAAATRTDIAQQQERRGSEVPAFANIGTPGFFTYRVEIKPTHEMLELLEVLTHRRANFQPGWPLRSCGRSSIHQSNLSHALSFPVR